MLMLQPKPKRITAHGDKIVTVMQSVEDKNRWLDRSEIAELLGKKRLTAYDTALLDLLTEQGLIETQKAEGYSREGYKWQHRIKQG